LIQIENISKSFNGRAVLRDVTLDIHEGETLAIIGRSGSGKSVLMKHTIGLLQPDIGRVLVDGIDIGRISYRELRKIRRQFGVLFQGGALFDSMSAFDNVAFPLRTFTNNTEQQTRDRALQCLKLVNLPDIGTKKPSELSGGMIKRVALARAIALEPRYILYDEPTSGLDPHTSTTINNLIRGLAEKLDITSIVVTHDMRSVLSIADRVAFIHETRMHWTGTLSALHRSTDETLRTFVKANEYFIGIPTTALDRENQ